MATIVSIIYTEHTQDKFLTTSPARASAANGSASSREKNSPATRRSPPRGSAACGRPGISPGPRDRGARIRVSSRADVALRRALRRIPRPRPQRSSCAAAPAGRTGRPASADPPPAPAQRWSRLRWLPAVRRRRAETSRRARWRSRRAKLLPARCSDAVRNRGEFSAAA